MVVGSTSLKCFGVGAPSISQILYWNVEFHYNAIYHEAFPPQYSTSILLISGTPLDMHVTIVIYESTWGSMKWQRRMLHFTPMEIRL